MDQPLTLFPDAPEVTIARLLAGDHRSTVATAESCTGGNIAGRMTSVAGSSAYFLGGIVAYDNTIKSRVLGVPESIIESYGAVSEQCAKAMAECARALFDTDYAVASTGIAGPGGGSRVKPVGLVFIGVSSPAATVVTQHNFAGDRRSVVDHATAAALQALLSAIERHQGSSRSIQDRKS
ncbi:MAG: CinA family protein, partial [Thermomicrobiales bacterium]